MEMVHRFIVDVPWSQIRWFLQDWSEAFRTEKGILNVLGVMADLATKMKVVGLDQMRPSRRLILMRLRRHLHHSKRKHTSKDYKHIACTHVKIYKLANSDLCIRKHRFPIFFSPSMPNYTCHLKKELEICLLYPSQGTKKAITNNIKDNSSGFVTQFMACQKQRREYSVACIHEYLIMHLCAIKFSQRGVMDRAHDCMVKCGRIKCMGIHSLPRNVTQQEMA